MECAGPDDEKTYLCIKNIVNLLRKGLGATFNSYNWAATVEDNITLWLPSSIKEI